MVLDFVPDVVPATLIAITQALLATRVPLESENVSLSAVAVAFLPRALLRFFGFATTSPSGGRLRQPRATSGQYGNRAPASSAPSRAARTPAARVVLFL